MARLDRQVNKKGGGLIIYIRDDLDYEVVDTVSNVNIEEITVLIKRKCQKPLCISLIYLPPKAICDIAIHYLDKLCDLVSLKDNEWVLGGDFNIDLNCNKVSKKRRTLQLFADKNLLTQVVKKPTRTSSTRASIIDHIYINQAYRNSNSGVISCGMSDHSLVFVSLKFNLPKKEKVSFKCRSLKNYSRECLERALTTVDWSNFWNERDVNIAWDMMRQIFVQSLNECAPIVEVNNVGTTE